MTDRVLVLGGSGFVGTHLVRRLHGEGVSVISLDTRPRRETLDGVDYRTGDVRDLSGLDLGGPVDRVYNLAAVHTTPGHPTHEYYETNVAGATALRRLAETHDIPEIVFTSSISVYGPGEDTKREETPPKPESAYGWSKFLAEGIHRAWADADPARRLVVARPAVVFGPGEGGNFTRLARLLRKGFFVYPGRRDTIKACIHVDDLVGAMEFARAHVRTSGERVVTFNGSYPEKVTLEQIVDHFRAKYFPKVKVVDLPRAAVVGAASMLRPMAVLDLGIHPDRVMKLVRSTDVYPGWLVAHDFPYLGGFREGIDRWAEATGGRFD